MSPAEHPQSPAELMAELRSGSPGAAGKLVERFYPELRRLAASRMRGEEANHTWQPTVLVHELYLQLARIKALPAGSPDEEGQKDDFFRLAAFLMKRLLIHHSRPLPKRAAKTELSAAIDSAGNGEQSLREIEDLLVRLGAIDPKLRSVVEMKVFEGLTREEIAARLGCSLRTVARHWEFAQKWLQQTIGS
jgi:RNA polymerase sigma factor (TIGR02999 family)